MGENQDLKVPTNRVTVELALRGGERRRVQLFLAEHDAHAFRQQSLLDLLGDERRFLPARDVDNDATLLFNKDSIAWVALSRPLAPEKTDDIELFEEDQRVEVRMRDGASLAGDVFYSPPEGGHRLVDHLNAGARYICMYSADQVYFVNKAFVQWVRECESGDKA
jgi:hypothetical protein